MTKEAYESYTAMCKKMGIKPTLHTAISANESLSDEQVALIAKKKEFETLPLGHVFRVTKAQLLKLVADTRAEVLDDIHAAD